MIDDLSIVGKQGRAQGQMVHAGACPWQCRGQAHRSALRMKIPANKPGLRPFAPQSVYPSGPCPVIVGAWDPPVLPPATVL
jgi:hypothetical protein